MQIFYEGDAETGDLGAAIDASPLPAPVRIGLADALRSFFGGAESVLDCRDMTATETGDLRVRVRLGRAGKLMAAALRALAASIQQEGHSVVP